MTIVILFLSLAAIGVFIFFYLNFNNLFGYAVGGFLALIPLFIAYIVYQRASTRMEMLSEEIYKGVKNVSVHPIEKRFIDIKERVKNRGRLNQEIIMSYDFYLIVKDEKIAVSEEDYYKYREAEVWAHFGISVFCCCVICLQSAALPLSQRGHRKPERVLTLRFCVFAAWVSQPH